jgi:hypothetical protein
MRIWHRVILLTISIAVPTAPAAAQEVTGEQVRAAIENGKQYLLRAQSGTGRWDDYALNGGTTALATLALIQAGVPLEDRRMQRAIAAVREIPLQFTYVVSLKTQALAVADAQKHRDQIIRAADWLSKAQQANGMWGYMLEGLRTDFSNSQFALLGLYEAARGGVRVNSTVWNRARGSWVNSQDQDGGWGYQPQGSTTTGSMTSAGIASLFICGDAASLARARGRSADGSVICCQPYAEYRPIARGLRWLARHFSVKGNPNGSYYFYYMYGMERAGILSGLSHIGEHDWYREGAAELIRRQRGDGSWQDVDSIVDTSFALLFLAKGHKPILFNKLQWSNDPNAWNLTRNDLPNLLAFIGDRLGEPMSWSAAPLDADLRAWMTAPILYFNGQDFPKFKPEEIEQLREYIRQGGTILAVATCDLAGFRRGFDAFARAAFPDDPLVRLPPDHPVFNSVFQLDGTKAELYGLAGGCRTGIFFSPRDIACLWDVAKIPNDSEQAFRLGTNIAAYATGLEPLPDKLDKVRLAEPEKTTDPTATAPARGAVHLGQLMHGGDWRPNTKSVVHLAEYLHDQLALDVIPTFEPLTATDEKLSQHPILYMTGHYTFELKPEEVEALRKHLEHGGFLLANACCGRQPFDTSFRKLAHQLFADHPLQPLPEDHPILTGQPGVPLTTIRYRPALLAEKPDLHTPQLEGITVDGRLVVVYSRYSLDCGMDGHKCFACRGIEHDDALRVAGNVILYALSY